MLDKKDQKYAEKVLKHLFIGTQIDGLQFGMSTSSIKLYFTNYKEIEDHGGQLFLNIETKWCLFQEPPESFPANEDDITHYSEDEEYRRIYHIRRTKVTDVVLGASTPHLQLKLENGSTVFVNGSHDMFECWQAGVEYDDEGWLVVAVPGDDIAIWTPDRFDDQ